MGLERHETSIDSIDLSPLSHISSEVAAMARDILEGLGQGDIGAVTFVMLIGSLTLGIGVFGIYFIGLVKEKGFWGAINDLEENYPMDPRQSSIFRKIGEESE